ncbi:MAG: hypothetical protein PHG66_05545 [Candidatus Colwellbacteria bacterium]|nr:hypothetical protein [Candidatus Colwellbacteria bacterium]
MDILHRSYAPSLHHSSAKTLFDMNMCSKKMDYLLIVFVILAIIWVLYHHYKRQQIEKGR